MDEVFFYNPEENMVSFYVVGLKREDVIYVSYRNFKETIQSTAKKIRVVKDKPFIFYFKRTINNNQRVSSPHFFKNGIEKDTICEVKE